MSRRQLWLADATMFGVTVGGFALHRLLGLPLYLIPLVSLPGFGFMWIRDRLTRLEVAVGLAALSAVTVILCLRHHLLSDSAVWEYAMWAIVPLAGLGGWLARRAQRRG